MSHPLGVSLSGMRKFLIFIVITNFLLGSTLAALFVLPHYRDWQKIKSEVFRQRAEIKNREDYFQNLETLKERLKSYQEKLEIVDSSLPQDPGLPSLFEFLQAEASKNGLVLKRAEAGQDILVKDSLGMEKKTAYLELAGDYPGFKKFIREMEISSRLIQTETLSFSYPGEGDSFLFSLTISVNYLKE